MCVRERENSNDFFRLIYEDYHSNLGFHSIKDVRYFGMRDLILSHQNNNHITVLIHNLINHRSLSLGRIIGKILLKTAMFMYLCIFIG